MSHETLVLVLGLSAWIFNLAGNILVMLKRSSGWILRTVSIFLWGAYGISDTSLPNLLNSITFFVFNLYAWHRWRKEERAKAPAPAHDDRKFAHKYDHCDDCGGPLLLAVGTDTILCRCTRWEIVSVETEDEGPGAA